MYIVFRLQTIRNSAILSINQTYIEKDTSVTLSSGDEIAFIPPLSGGYELKLVTCLHLH